MNAEFCEDNSGTSKEMRYFRKNKVGARSATESTMLTEFFKRTLL